MTLLVLLLRSLKLRHPGRPQVFPFTDQQMSSGWVTMMDVRSGSVELSSLNVRRVKSPSHTTMLLGLLKRSISVLCVCVCGGGVNLLFWNLIFPPPKILLLKILHYIYYNVTSCLVKQSGFRIRGRLCDQITKPNSTFLEKSAIWSFEKNIKFMQISLAAPYKFVLPLGSQLLGAFLKSWDFLCRNWTLNWIFLTREAQL